MNQSVAAISEHQKLAHATANVKHKSEALFERSVFLRKLSYKCNDAMEKMFFGKYNIVNEIVTLLYIQRICKGKTYYRYLNVRTEILACRSFFLMHTNHKYQITIETNHQAKEYHLSKYN